MTRGLVKIDSVYVAASSDEVERNRAQHWINTLASAGLTCTSPWIKSIEDHGVANPRGGADANGLRIQVSNENRTAIDAASLLWMLAPPAGIHTCGAWWEAGYAVARNKIVIYSGDDTARSVFASLGQEFKDDLSAFATICRLTRDGAWV